MGKVKEYISLAVKIPSQLIETLLTISYEDNWFPDERTWRFQTWIDYAKCYVNVQGHLNKDGSMSRNYIHASICSVASTFWENPYQLTYIPHRIISYK